MDIEQARFNMVEQQIRPWEVLDQTVLDLLFKVRREEFVPAAYRSLSFIDMEIPLGQGEAMWAPKLEARALQALQLKKTDKVLEIGTGSGYLTALLASLAGHVYSVEIHAEFTNAAQARLKAHGFDNVTLETGDGSLGWEKHAPYDAIIVTGSLPVMPVNLPAQLAPGGRLFAMTGDDPVMEAQLITCVSRGTYRTESLFETSVKPLINAPQPERFVF
ncbi:MAG: protein-L-isoaspartate O-methyltransferase [Hydrogenophilaceae bacterium]|nr:protein-L-isoaspartate O-methyltransferase [Hydrogenophilaceae bacterium]